MEIDSNITINRIYLLTETQQKFDKLALSQGLTKVENNREFKDKTGGGLMIVFNIEIEKLKTQQKDILYTKCQIFNLELKILLVYFSAGNSEEDKQRDGLIRKECEKLIQNCTDSEKLIVFGDFNGHIGFSL